MRNCWWFERHSIVDCNHNICNWGHRRGNAIRKSNANATKFCRRFWCAEQGDVICYSPLYFHRFPWLLAFWRFNRRKCYNQSSSHRNVSSHPNFNHQILMLSLPHAKWTWFIIDIYRGAQIVKIAIVLGVLFTFSLQLYVCIEIVWNGIKDRFSKNEALANYVLRYDSHKKWMLIIFEWI